LEQDPLLEVRNASVVRSGKRILDNVSLSINDSEHTAIVGPNGSGKSSLIKLITRRFYPVVGADVSPVVRMFGHERWDVFDLRSMMGILTPDLHSSFGNDESLTAFDAALSGFFASQGTATHHKITEDMRTKTEAALREANVHHLRDRRLVTMSTGEVRRVLIARALVTEPKAFLLDEPTAGLDLSAMRRLLATIRHLAKQGKTIILVTHHVEEIVPEIQRVILMKNGRIFADGPKSELLTTAVLSDLFDESIEVRESGGFYSANLTS
jgi:iron complex transport system ATP-binding protein